jgi:hypothetical protein
MAAHGTSMTERRGRRTPAGAWLGVIAMLLQVLLPVLVGFEMSGAAAAGGSGAGPCLLMHGAAPSDQPDAAAPAHHHEGGAPAEDAPYGKGLVPCCALCTALQAAHGFTTPAAIGVPAPRFHGVAAPAGADEPVVVATYSASYSSRAPPPIG